MVLIDGKSVVVKRSVNEPDANGARVGEGIESRAGPSTSSMLAGPMAGMPPFMNPAAAMAGMGAMNPAAAMGGNMGGNFDFFAHMAAAARMQAAMMRAMEDSDTSDEEPLSKKAKFDDEGPAFDKDALQRLAQEASERKDEPPPRPPQQIQAKSLSEGFKTSKGEGSITRTEKQESPAPMASYNMVPPPPPESTSTPLPTPLPAESEEVPPPPPVPAQDRQSPEPPEPEPAQDIAEEPSQQQVAAQPELPPEKKKDATALTSLLEQVQSNVALGREATKVIQSFSFGQAVAGAGPATTAPRGASSNVGSALDILCHRIDEGIITSDMRRAVEEEVLEMLPTLEPVRSTELVVRVASNEALRNAEFLELVIQVVQPSLAKLNSPQMTRVLGAFATWAISAYGGISDEDVKNAKLSDRCRDFFIASATELSLRLMDVVPRDLSQIATALSSVGHVDARLYGSLARAAVARSERFTPAEIVALGVAFDRSGFFHTALLEAVAKAIRNNIMEVPPRDLLRAMTALGRAGVRDNELGQVVGELLSKRHQHDFTAEELCAFAWAFCTLGIYHDSMFRAVLVAMEDATVVSSETLCMLYEMHMALAAFRHDLYKKYELPADTVQSLRDHYKKHRGGKLREQKMDRTSERVQKDVVSSLGRVASCSCQKQYQTATGLSVDIAVLRRRSNSKTIVLVEVDGAHTLLQCLDPQVSAQAASVFRVRGDVLLKRRLLQQAGFHMAVFGEEIWKGLDDGRDKRDFLRDLLRIAGVRDSRMLRE